MVELRAALTLLLDRLEDANDKRVRAAIANEGLERRVAALLEENASHPIALRKITEANEALSASLGRRMDELANAAEHKRKQEAACAKLYSAVENLLLFLQALPASGKVDREEAARRSAVVRAEMNNAFEYCDQIPF